MYVPACTGRIARIRFKPRHPQLRWVPKVHFRPQHTMICLISLKHWKPTVCMRSQGVCTSMTQLSVRWLFDLYTVLFSFGIHYFHTFLIGSHANWSGQLSAKKGPFKNTSPNKNAFSTKWEEYVAYRKGYLEWRRGSAGGARGELTAEALENQALADHGTAPQSEGAYGNWGNSWNKGGTTCMGNSIRTFGWNSGWLNMIMWFKSHSVSVSCLTFMWGDQEHIVHWSSASHF